MSVAAVAAVAAMSWPVLARSTSGRRCNSGRSGAWSPKHVGTRPLSRRLPTQRGKPESRKFFQHQFGSRETTKRQIVLAYVYLWCLIDDFVQICVRRIHNPSLLELTHWKLKVTLTLECFTVYSLVSVSYRYRKKWYRRSPPFSGIRGGICIILAAFDFHWVFVFLEFLFYERPMLKKSLPCTPDVPTPLAPSTRRLCVPGRRVPPLHPFWGQSSLGGRSFPGWIFLPGTRSLHWKKEWCK